ncbi:GcrA family cell cycle regulator [Phenylobacterium sp.]|jgi:GcrA cell cycle regulator|uniref:GcrA family cell cycle regulator n=1 Tax=Phenylobacterium sp. TaxID=1871053 RepID=UPI002F950C22
MSSLSWTDERVARLERLWLAGCSGAEIARALGVSRCAVLGKVHRLGLQRKAPRAPASTAAREAAPGSRVRARPAKCAAPSAAPRSAATRAAVLALTSAEPATGAETVLSVRRDHCRWPYGDPRADEFRLCGDPVVRGAYCGPHAARAYVGPSSDRQRTP